MDPRADGPAAGLQLTQADQRVPATPAAAATARMRNVGRLIPGRHATAVSLPSESQRPSGRPGSGTSTSPTTVSPPSPRPHHATPANPNPRSPLARPSPPRPPGVSTPPPRPFARTQTQGVGPRKRLGRSSPVVEGVGLQ